MTTDPGSAGSASDDRPSDAPEPRPWVLLGASVVVAVVLLAPLVFLLIEATGPGFAPSST